MASLENGIKEKARQLGYEACGIIAAGIFEEFLTQLNTRSELFPHAKPFYDNLRKLAIPKQQIDWAKSVIVCVRRYDKYRIPDGLDRLIGKVFLCDGRLNYSQEYKNNVAFEEYLQQLGFRTVTNAVPARWAAVKAGLGKFRNNNFLYREQGSWVWVDTWVVDKGLEVQPAVDSPQFSCPEGCQKCIKACPTGALSAPLTMDATKCIACRTFRSELKVEESLLEKMGTWLYGCDICQNVCPANANTWQENESCFEEPLSLPELITLEKLFSLDDSTYRTNIQPRFWYINAEDGWFWKCKVIRAMANEDAQKYQDYFLQALNDSHEEVKKMARWALRRRQ
ncbi:epoxyqueuosine reductase [Sporomusa acidovorans]|uniref:Epoxyqueuosine reductase n=1 Tax=Sporomusa acidovorans (strain ATCC 49682 / DSM 3132 / Mol) TaxID=1123286 RepID=A0ABZ3IWF2_SPOA4|nr:4Fe-4S double cluster binding domain-containing protein [Sporomusa acidovorans]OZC23892.1 epoxyqueuosine reductase [Sporomusa acidovorans DSM 3132]SDF54174.1 Epoxyqueuosine reductase QueG (queuosine biosynthesis) [Sporomusa acidovorans]